MAPARKRTHPPIATSREARPIRTAVARVAAIPTVAMLLELGALGCRQPAPVVSAEPASSDTSVTAPAPSAPPAASASSASAVVVLPASASASASAVASAPPCASSAKVASSARPAEPGLLERDPGLVGLPPNPNVNVAGGVGVVNPGVTGTATVAPPPAPPRDATATVGAAMPGADAVVAKNRWRFRACAKKAAAIDPSSGGSVKVVAKVDAEGKVTSVTASGGSPASLTSCIQGSFYSMTFPAPERADASVVVTVVITKGS